MRAAWVKGKRQRKEAGIAEVVKFRTKWQLAPELIDEACGRGLPEELRLDDYKGSNWAGWHYHVTLVMMAHAFPAMESLRSKKTPGWALLRRHRELQCLLCACTGSCCYCCTMSKRIAVHSHIT